MTLMESAKQNQVRKEFEEVAKYEQVSVDFIMKGVASGEIVIPKNINRSLKIIRAVGKGLKTKINANYLPIAMIYHVINYDKSKNISHLEIKLITGKTHQIRAHLNFLNHPIIGEQKYLKKEFKKNTKYKSQCLIAAKIHFNFKNNPTFLDYLKTKIISLKKIIF